MYQVRAAGFEPANGGLRQPSFLASLRAVSICHTILGVTIYLRPVLASRCCTQRLAEALSQESIAPAHVVQER